MSINYTIYDFPTLDVRSQLFHAPGQAFEGGFTSGGVRVSAPEPGGRAYLEMELSLQVNEWNSPFASWLMSKINGDIFRVPLVRTPQIVSSVDLDLETSELFGVPWESAIPYGGVSVGGVSYSQDFTGSYDATKFTFSRASIGTYVDIDGLLKTAAIDVVRVTHAPTTGVLVEPERTNLYSRNTEIDNAAWTKTNVTVVVNEIASPTGTIDADRIVEAASTGVLYYVLRSTPTLQIGEQVVLSAFVKEYAGGGAAKRYFTMWAANGGAITGQLRVTFDVATGSVAATGIPSGDYGFEDYGNGWKRCWIKVTATAVGVVSFRAKLSNALSGATDITPYNGDGISGMYLWGLQAELGAKPTSVLLTTTTTVTRSADHFVALNTQDNNWTITYGDNTTQAQSYRGDLQLHSVVTKYVIKTLTATRTANDDNVDVPWDDGNNWSYGAMPVPVTSEALEGTTIVVVDMSLFGPILKVGHVIGFEDNAYLVDDIEYDENTATITVKPPLRRDVEAGDDISLRPVFTGSISNGSEIRAAYEAANVGHVQPARIIFTEVII